MTGSPPSRFSDQYDSASALSGVSRDVAHEMVRSGLLDGSSTDDVVPTKIVTLKSVGLKPTQKTLVLDYIVGTAMEMLAKGQAPGEYLGSLVSSDNYILDGHHRWAAGILAHGPSASSTVWRSSVPAATLVRILNIITKGQYGVSSGNAGSGSIRDLNPTQVRNQVEEYLLKGRQNAHFSMTPEKAAEILVASFGSVEEGVAELARRSKMISKKIPSWAPSRKDMPVIEPRQAPDTARLLQEGEVDWSPPYSDSLGLGSRSIGLLSIGETPMRPDPKRVAARFANTRSKTAAMTRTAGEVRFIKDRSGDANQWGWGTPGPNERSIQPDFVFNARHLKPLAKTLRSALMALGHTTSAYNRLVKVKSRNVSPDGALGGKGYIQKIPDMRRQLMNCVEALSAFTDTVYDEMNAPHWNPGADAIDARDREEVREIIEDAEEIKEDPEGWAQEQEIEMDDENGGMGKTASSRRRRRFRRMT